jgi:hypothetical protein
MILPITYQYDQNSNIIRAEADGVLTAKNLFEYLNDIIEDQQIKKDFIEIIDFQNVCDLVIAYSDTDGFRYMWKKYLSKGCKKVIVLAPTDLSYGTSRMIKTVIGFVDQGTEDMFVVVRSTDELENELHDLDRII